MWNPETYLTAWRFAAEAHVNQTMPSADTSYLTHLGMVSMEVMCALAQRRDVELPDLAVQCAVLHDVVEDTPVTIAEVAARFGDAVAAGVAALTKDKTMADRRESMRDSLDRIQAQPPEVWMVKLADRTSNLGPPPAHWTEEKMRAYQDEARDIHEALKAACPILGARLASKIAAYPP